MPAAVTLISVYVPPTACVCVAVDCEVMAVAGLTVTATTFDATAPVQSAMQVTLARRWYQVLAVSVPGA